MQKVATCLWFDGQAEEAMNFYTSIFKNADRSDHPSADAERTKTLKEPSV